MTRYLRALRALPADARGRARRVVTGGVRTGLAMDLGTLGLTRLAAASLTGTVDLSTVYRAHATAHPDRPAIVDLQATRTYRTLVERVDRLAQSLSACRVGRGHAVVVALENRAELLELAASTSRIDATFVPASPRATVDELGHILQHCEARTVFVEAERIDVARSAADAAPGCDVYALRHDANARDHSHSQLPIELPPFERVRAAREPASPRADRGRGILAYTSGTTGRPKGARRTLEANLADAVLGTLGALPLRAGERHLVVCPLYHSTAFGFASFASTLGGTLFLEPSFSATGFLERVDRDRITSTAVVPTMLHRLLDVPGSTAARYDLSSLRAVLCGGAPLPPSIAERFQERFGLILYNFYGSTETGINTLATPNDLIAAPGTVGRPVDGNDIRLWDDRGEEVDPGRVGTLYVRNRMLVSGYHRAPGATDASTRHGYFTVGDLAYRDDHGRLHIAGRGHDMIISGGVNVYPAEVEAALLRHPRIADAAVTGVPDEEWGERVVAFVVADPRPEEGELEAFVRDHLSAPKRPRRFVFVSELPRTPTGKVEKARLRSLL